MKVAINTLPLRSGHKFRGIGSYTQNLLYGLKKSPGIEVQEFCSLSEIKEVDIVHYPFFDLFKKSLPFNRKFPTIVTVHDVIPLIFPQHYPIGIRGKVNLAWQKLALRNAAAVITDSENSKKDIQKYLGISLEKIHVVYLSPSNSLINYSAVDCGVSLRESSSVNHSSRQGGYSGSRINTNTEISDIGKKYNLPNVFALYIGDVNWNKNLSGMAQACLDTGIDLCLVGKGFEKRDDLNHPEMQSFKEFLEKFSNNPHIHLLGFVPDEDLRQIWHLANIALLVSFYEGFGLTILESQSLGIPVITSNISSMPEVAGNGALLVNPYKTSEISLAIKNIINGRNLRKELIENGYKNIKRFSMEKVAIETIEVYRKVISR